LSHYSVYRTKSSFVPLNQSIVFVSKSNLSKEKDLPLKEVDINVIYSSSFCEHDYDGSKEFNEGLLKKLLFYYL